MNRRPIDLDPEEKLAIEMEVQEMLSQFEIENNRMVNLISLVSGWDVTKAHWYYHQHLNKAAELHVYLTKQVDIVDKAKAEKDTEMPPTETTPPVEDDDDEEDEEKDKGFYH